MNNRFYSLIQSIQATLGQSYDITERCNQAHDDYLILSGRTQDARQLTFDSDLSHDLTEQHVTIFKKLEQEHEHSAYHYTAKFNDETQLYMYRLRVFFNDKDEPMGVSWYRKKIDELDDCYVDAQLEADDISKAIEFATQQIKPAIAVIRQQQKLKIDELKRAYQHAQDAYEQLIDNQTEESAFDTQQALVCVEAMQASLLSQEALGVNHLYHQFRYVQKLKILIETSVQVFDDHQATSNSVEKHVADEPAIIHPVAVKSQIRHTSTIQIAALEALFLEIESNYLAVPALLINVPARNEKIINDAYLTFFDGLKPLYQRCCESYLLLIDSSADIKTLKALHALTNRMDLIIKNQQAAEEKYVSSLLLFAHQNSSMIQRLRSCQAIMNVLPVPRINAVIRGNKHEFLSIILGCKQLTLVELTEIMKTILTTNNTCDCLTEIINKGYPIHSILLQKDEQGVPLVSYLFRLPLSHPIRVQCEVNIPALSSVGFYQKLYKDLTTQPDIDNARAAERLYVGSSKKKYQIKQYNDFIKNMPKKLKKALEQLSLAPVCQNKVMLLRAILNEIDSTLAILSTSNPDFVKRLREESKSQSKQCQFELCKNESTFVGFLQEMQQKNQVDTFLDEMIEYYNFLNQYLCYCLPISTQSLSVEKCSQLREYYFKQLQRFGMQNNPYQALLNVVSALKESLSYIQEAFEAHLKVAKEMEKNPTPENIEEWMKGFEQIQQISEQMKQVKPCLDAYCDDSENSMRLK